MVYSDKPYEPFCTKGRNSYSVLTLLGNKQGVLRLTVYRVFKPTYRTSFFQFSALPVQSTTSFQTWTMEQGTLSIFVSRVKLSEKEAVFIQAC